MNSGLLGVPSHHSRPNHLVGQSINLIGSGTYTSGLFGENSVLTVKSQAGIRLLSISKSGVIGTYFGDNTNPQFLGIGLINTDGSLRTGVKGIASSDKFDVIINSGIYARFAYTDGLLLNQNVSLCFNNGNIAGAEGGDVILGRRGVAILGLGRPDAAAPVGQTLQVQSVVAGTTDTAGTPWTRRASLGTGLGAGGNCVEQTGFSAKTTGTGQHTAVDRSIIVAKGKVLTDNSAVSLFEIALPTLAMAGGVIEATVVCTDGTDEQSFSQTITYSAVNKGGVYTKSITASAGDKSVSAGTITNTWSILDGTNKVTIQLTSDTSLVPSTNAFLCYYTVKNNSEQATTIL